MYQLLTAKKPQDIEHHFSGKSYKDLKEELAEVVIDHLKPLRDRYLELIATPSDLDDLLQRGAEKADLQAEKRLKSVMEAIGLK